jgi:hypothetical protein
MGIEGYKSVQNYLDQMAEKPEEERRTKLEVLAEFCAFVERTPDQMVEEIFNVETRKYRKRGFYTERVQEFSEQIEGTWKIQTKRGNVVRGFFIANGRRLPTPKPPWM